MARSSTPRTLVKLSCSPVWNGPSGSAGRSLVELWATIGTSPGGTSPRWVLRLTSSRGVSQEPKFSRLHCCGPECIAELLWMGKHPRSPVDFDSARGSDSDGGTTCRSKQLFRLE